MIPSPRGLLSKNHHELRVEGTLPTPRPTATMVVQEFYVNLAAHVLKKVRVRGVLVDFSANSINEFYNLEPVNCEAYVRLQENPNYPKVLRLVINGQGEWQVNSEGHAVHFKAKHSWPTFTKCGIILSLPASFRLLTYAK